jgi:hypothetical protein
MSVIGAPEAGKSSRLWRGGSIGAGILGLFGALSVAIFSNPYLARTAQTGVSDALRGAKTVAAMLAERSPGERIEGALASLKPKKHAAVHERALPKIREGPPQPGPYAALVAPPPIAGLVPPPAGTPLYNMVTGGPTGVTPLVTGGGPTGGPPGLSIIPGPGGGGGGIITTPNTPSTPGTPGTPETPGTPVTPVPEPASWLMMLLGFALMAGIVRRRESQTRFAVG